MKSKVESRKSKGTTALSCRFHFRLPPSAFRLASAMLFAAALSGCGTAPSRDAPVAKAPPARAGGYYLDDGPGENPPANLDSIPDAVPRLEPLHRGAIRPYVVMGRHYTPMTALAPYKARGLATWYGRRYHGKMTSTGEIYDMYGMTAAHTVLPIPSYVRVTNLQNGRSVIVRVNDRGPFIDNRLIDVSYTAAHRLGILATGSAQVEVESILPDATGAMVAAAPTPAPAPREAAPGPAASPAADSPPAPAHAAPQVALAAGAGGFYLQLGAFGSRENAESFLARLRAQMDWLAQALHVFPRDGLHRVHAGPYASQAEARQVAERITEALGAKPFVLTR
ncbi:MAG: septal ring lytic transglycosylase RlpA family protein [Betaproteobacteria bacterium]|nr:septal ring lytic transglycosylase RlpA family protein [Betaproteobacteria bacterium]